MATKSAQSRFSALKRGRPRTTRTDIMKAMRAVIPRIFAAALAAALATSQLPRADAQDTGGPKYHPGDRVVVIREAELRVPEGVVDQVWPGLVLKISVVNDKWLWVSHGKPGWIDSADV